MTDPGAEEVGEAGAEPATSPGRSAAAAADQEERDNRYRRRVAVVLALLAVIGAWINILESDAGTNESHYARETTRVAVDSLRANVNRATVLGLETDVDAEQQTLVQSGRLEADAAGSGEGRDSLAGVDREALGRTLTLEANRLDLERKALAETRVTFNNRASQYQTVLTTLAVALFLVGFTMVLSRKTRPPILVPGLVLAAYVVGWALWIHHREVPFTPDDAIEAVAAGDTATTYGELDGAIRAYDRAIELDSDFVPAYNGRSLAAFLAANPDFRRTLAVVSTEGELVDQARQDADEAVRLGLDQDFAGLLLSGLYRFYDGDYDGAVRRLDEAAAVNDRSPEVHVVMGVAELARGNPEAVAAAFAAAGDLLDTEGASVQNREVVAEALTLLEFVEHTDPSLASRVAEVRDRLAERERELVTGQSDQPELPDRVALRLDRMALDGDEVVLDLAWSGLPDSTDVSLYLYEQPADGAAFVQAPELARFSEESSDGRARGSVAIERACRPVALRLDVYLDGVLTESFDAPGGEATCGL